MPPTPLLDARDLAKSYRQRGEPVHALRQATLRLDAGNLVAVQGRSGSGKTTLLNLVAGLEDPDEGTVHVLGRDLATLSARERLALRAEHVGFIFQEPALVPELTLEENVALAARIRGLTGTRSRDAARSSLADVGLADLTERFPSEVSGGEAQRASVARALAKSPRLLLADEPTAELDHGSARVVTDVLKAYVAQGDRACLTVTHDDILAKAAHRRLRMRDGVLREEEPQP